MADVTTFMHIIQKNTSRSEIQVIPPILSPFGSTGASALSRRLAHWLIRFDPVQLSSRFLFPVVVVLDAQRDGCHLQTRPNPQQVPGGLRTRPYPVPNVCRHSFGRHLPICPKRLASSCIFPDKLCTRRAPVVQLPALPGLATSSTPTCLGGPATSACAPYCAISPLLGIHGP